MVKMTSQMAVIGTSIGKPADRLELEGTTQEVLLQMASFVSQHPMPHGFEFTMARTLVDCQARLAIKSRKSPIEPAPHNQFAQMLAEMTQGEVE